MVDFKSEMWEESMDLGAVNKLIDKKYVAKKSSAKTFVKAINDIQQVLSEKQRAKWRAILLAQKLNKCTKCAAAGGKCAKCASSGGGKFCPLTGKPLGVKGSNKGSMK